MELEVLLVSGRRPALLERTLESFGTRLFPHFAIHRVCANIDPFDGDAADQKACRDLILGRFPDAELHEPETPSFGAAVKRLWSGARGPWVLHLEDDWLLREDVGAERLGPLLGGDVVDMPLLTRELPWDGGSLRMTRREPRRFLGVKVPQARRVARFGTSPRFMAAAFARRCGELMVPRLDPEKQMLSKWNPALARFQRDFRSEIIVAGDRGPIAVDIGREWRDARGLRKVLGKDGSSHWIGTGGAAEPR